ncbi:MAG: formyltetrahydrofolate-dependent phosphoribosylglycinamide formyltransferase [Ferruginibacter sp.]|uniref:phosphoribosylglycinamide formyltransferase n=1 Tax=Ferruginibacter sp. TaxID=1940288 RepID=UPI0026586E7C|nr:phosphoribosylglycinamide formyltransferase [Ferruginibacter sp.]MDB5276856.1 formyltetrahydrofolate-dependent phosphoribosylglycinamide formyltransferase [Ferruginibacter sp.]
MLIIFAGWLATTSFLIDFCRMLQKLQQRWKVNGINLILIIFTFAIGGSFCGLAARKILAITSIEEKTIWIFSYIVLVSLLWPVCVLLVSIPFGQFSFFKGYLVKVWDKISGKKIPDPPLIAIFASGAGSNAQKIIAYFNAHSGAGKVALIVCNKPGAGVLDIAKQHHINTMLLDKEQFFHSDNYISEFKKLGIQFIVLAGFLWKIPSSLIKAYPNKIVNIHPALLPKYGGKGMYGSKVHEAVIAAGEKESGITIHYVDELYDHGNIIYQATCKIDAADDAGILAQKIHLLEHQHYPTVIEQVLKLQNRS